jgi:dUTP pyrophosphatase
MSSDVVVELKKLPHFAGLALPARMTGSSAGFDLAAAVDEPLTVKPGEFTLVPTGLAVAIPGGYEGQIRPRSGLAFKHGLSILNSPGTIDADYRGEVKVLVINHGHAAYSIKRGDRIAQLVIAVSPRVELREVAKLRETTRGEGGFGHTGK